MSLRVDERLQLKAMLTRVEEVGRSVRVCRAGAEAKQTGAEKNEANTSFIYLCVAMCVLQSANFFIVPAPPP